MWSGALAMPVAAAALACAGAPAVPVSMPSSGGTAGGEVILVASGSVGTGASYDERRVVGPTVNMEMTPEGVWGGDLRGRNLLLEISEGRLAGAGFQVMVEREGDDLRLSGLVGNSRVNLRLSPKRFQGAVGGGACSFDLALASPGAYRGVLSCIPPRFERPLNAARTPLNRRMPTVTPATLKLAGDAAQLGQPALPQLALALLAVLPAP